MAHNASHAAGSQGPAVVSVVELLVIAVVSSLEDSVVEGPIVEVVVDEEVVEDVESVVLEELVGLFEVVGSVVEEEVEVVVVVPLSPPSAGPQAVIHAVIRRPREVRIPATLHDRWMLLAENG